MELVEVLTHFDSKVLRSSWLLLTRPGLLSREYFAGRRVRYLAPLRLFLLVSLVYFLSLSLYDAHTFTTPLQIQLHGNDFYPGFAARQVERKLQTGTLDFTTLERQFNATTGALSKTLVFVLIPVIALLLYALFFHRRRYFAEHLVVATHFWCFSLILIGIALPLCIELATAGAALLHRSVAPLTTDMVLSVFLQICIAVYLYPMLRTAYGVSRAYAALLALAFAWSFFFVVWLFRFFLFIGTMLLI